MSEIQRIESVRPEFVEMELSVLHRLLENWCCEDVITRRAEEWEKKLPAFRRAVSAGQGTGSKETWPRELAASECWVVLQAIRAARKRNTDRKLEPSVVRSEPLVFDVSLENGAVHRFARPFPAPKTWKTSDKSTENLNWKRRFKGLAWQIVTVRIGGTERWLKGAIKRWQDEKRTKYLPSIAQRHLASVYLDLCSIAIGKDQAQPLEEVFRTLVDTGCHCLFLYYLVQVAHTLRYPIVSEEHDPDEVRGLCAATREAYAQCHRPATAAD